MIVAGDRGVSGAGTFIRRKRNFKAVQRSVPGSDIAYAQPPQLPTFNLSAKLKKPFIVVDPPQFKGVPLKCLQQYSHAEGAMLMDAPILLIPEPLKVVIPSSAKIDYDRIVADLDVPFRPEFQYDKGIRPGVRNLKVDAVDEPANPYPTRPVGQVAPSKVQTGTFRVGSKDYDLLGY